MFTLRIAANSFFHYRIEHKFCKKENLVAGVSDARSGARAKGMQMPGSQTFESGDPTRAYSGGARCRPVHDGTAVPGIASRSPRDPNSRTVIESPWN